ncbi:calmodulin 4 [Solea senegalensis]|uniref:Calmodulin 4 n=1 Tax=Solea senegalensis TaxID=28829 RepID=A0AAV6SYV4_SOLSE|nr:calmodulin 4 [Solea senegalensis]
MCVNCLWFISQSCSLHSALLLLLFEQLISYSPCDITAPSPLPPPHLPTSLSRPPALTSFLLQRPIKLCLICFSQITHDCIGPMKGQMSLSLSLSLCLCLCLAVFTDRSGELDFSTFLTIMHRQLQQEAPEEEILEALRMADKEQKGFVRASELRATLTGHGEKLTHKEVDELLKEAGVGADGRVHCEQFAKAVTHSSVKR